jgi:Asp-tRNA(Asn)/Glu-tRNA(Gln) amidotransferase A subunit family amidase
MVSDPVKATGPFAGTTLTEVAGRLRDGTADPVRLVEQVLDAVAVTQPVLNAFVSVDAVGAVAAARAAGSELAVGVDRGVLHGIPVAVKDLVDTAGLTTTMGSRHFDGNVPLCDAEVITRLRGAGAIVVGKTTTHEFAYGPTGDRAANGACANPHDPTRMAGGSSAGSAAAVAAGLVPLAVGTDTGGSVRIPAALCGVVGVRPTVALVPTAGVFPLSWSLDTVGVIASDVAGAAAGLQVLTCTTVRATGHSGLLSPAVAVLRIGLATAPLFDRLDPTVRDCFDAFLRALQDAGAIVAPVEVADADELAWLYRTVQSVEAVAIHHDRLTSTPELFDPEVLERLQVAAQVPAHTYASALKRLGEVRAAAEQRFAGLDLLALPTVPVLAPPLGARDADIGGGWTSPRDALLAHTAAWSVLGVPSISIPIPVSIAAPVSGAAGLPVGAQLIAPPGQDAQLLGAARAIERLIGP